VPLTVLATWTRARWQSSERTVSSQSREVEHDRSGQQQAH
jgi:hypothetical protein